MGRARALVDHPIDTPDDFGLAGAKDEVLIPWMAERGYVWITKDEAARRQHGSLLSKNHLSVVWGRGLDRQKSGITAKQLHLMLTVKLADIQEHIERGRGPLWFLLYLKSVSTPTLRPLSPFQPLPGATRARGVREA